jgi:glucan biosynthesis protein
MQKQYRIKPDTSSSDRYIESMPALADSKLELATPAYRLCAITINQLFQYILFYLYRSIYYQHYLKLWRKSMIQINKQSFFWTGLHHRKR